MDVVTAPNITHSFIDKAHITTSDIPHILSHYEGKINILSLDCFDTLLWRKTAAPMDVFYDMQHRPIFQSLGVTAYQRMAAAQRAYRGKFIAENNRQISLNDIYENFTALSQEQKDLLANEELQAEIDACYAFPPFVELIREASQRGIKIIIVSDIYFSEKQLRELLASHLPNNVYQSIDQVYCSFDYGKSKSDGLFQLILGKLAQTPQSILHIGDHLTADYESPKKLGIRTHHFLQFNDKVNDFLRLQHAVSPLAALANPAISYSHHGRYSPFRGVFATHHPAADKPETLIGYMTLGPILYAFTRFISDELALLHQTGRKIKPFFLLRDAYLLHRACEAYSGHPLGKLARIRKFVAVAASFRTQKDVDYYISGIAPQHYNVWVICEQLLLPRELILQIIKAINTTANPQETFNQIIHQEAVLQLIFKNSAEARARLKKYIIKEMQIEPGDTLVLIDTGYIGVTQDFLARALSDELGIEIIGRYFISSHEPDRPDCKSLMTSSWCEHGLFEQSCTFKEGSVLGYDNNGDPIFDAIKLHDNQYQKVQAVQDECVRFISDAKKFFNLANAELPFTMLQKTAEAALHRHIFFPLPEEITYFQDFQHDKDMGENSKKTMFNLSHAVNVMQQSLLPYKPHPYETRAINVDMSLSALVKKAYNIEFSQEEKSYCTENIKVTLFNETNKADAMIKAVNTLDGYFSICLNVPANMNLGFLFGETYQWMQIDNIYLLNHQNQNVLTNENSFVLFKMRQNKSLFECESKEGLLILKPLEASNKLLTYQIIFRPIVRWATAVP